MLGWDFTAFVLVFVETTPPHSVRIFELDPYQDAATGEMVDPIAIGREQNHQALRTFKRCLDAGEWPAGPSDSTPLRMPGWYRQAALARTTDDRVNL